MHESVIRVRNQIEVLLEQAQIKLSSVVTDILGKSGRRMLDALVRGLSDPVELAELGDRRLLRVLGTKCYLRLRNGQGWSGSLEPTTLGLTGWLFSS